MIQHRPTSLLFGLALLVPLFATPSCGITSHRMPTGEDLKAFEAAGPVRLELDRARLTLGTLRQGPYRLVEGDLLEIRGLADLVSVTSKVPVTRDYLVRVQKDGEITLPLGKSVAAKGKTLVQVEKSVADAVSGFLKNRPAIVAQVKSFMTRQVTVVGAVESPGVHELRSDQLTLYDALSLAGGILKASNLKVGARVIRIRKPGQAQQKAFTLPVKGLNVPDENVALSGGETIEVNRFEHDLFTVIGLVRKPGAFEYPPERDYNLMQALAIAGGTDQTAYPPYATVFREDKDGRILATSFPITGEDSLKAVAVRIKPGDVIAVQHTVASWTRSLIAQVLRFQFGFFVDPRRN